MCTFKFIPIIKNKGLIQKIQAILHRFHPLLHYKVTWKHRIIGLLPNSINFQPQGTKGREKKKIKMFTLLWLNIVKLGLIEKLYQIKYNFF